MIRKGFGQLAWAEWAVVGATLLSVVLLCFAAASPIADPKHAAQLAERDEVERAGERLHTAWQSLLLEGAPAKPFGDVFHWQEPLAPAPQPSSPGAAGAMDLAFDLDLMQATHAELLDQDLERARAWVEEALRLPKVSSERRGRGYLRALQLALASGDSAAAHQNMNGLLSEVDWDAVEDGVPMLLLGTLALGRGMAESEASSLLSRAIEAWLADRLAFDGMKTRVTSFEDGVRVREDEQVVALRQLLVGMSPDHVNPLQKVEQREAVRGLFEHIEPIGIAEEAYGVRRWTVRKTPLGWFAQGPDDQSDGWIGHFVDPQACAERLQDHARRTKALGEGYEVLLESSGSPAHRVFFGSVAERGDGVGFYLMNTGPEGLGSTEYQRAMIARAALLAAALAVALAGGATFFTLRRVRSLGELRSRFIANVSHDLRTPLASILLMAENLESGRVQDEKRVAIYHSKIRSEGARLRRMVDEVLDFSAIEHGERPKTITMDFELEPWVIELRESFDDLARRFGLQLSFVWNDLPANMVGDSSALRRVFDNLVDNALKHGAEPVEVSLGVRQGALCFEVRDHGSGIPAAQRSKVFDAFVRLDEERKGKPPGAGLGLAMARELVQAHGGTLVLGTPSEGSGALFTCLLPMEGAND